LPPIVKIKFKYHGNYCGPGYGDPTYKQQPVDQLDALCKQHDIEYDTPGENLAVSDWKFAHKAWKYDKLASLYFFGQGSFRHLYQKFYGETPEQTEMTKGKNHAKNQKRKLRKKIAKTGATKAIGKKNIATMARRARPGKTRRGNGGSAAFRRVLPLLGVNTPLKRLPRGKYSIRGSNNNLVIRGCDFVGRPTIAANQPAGTTVFQFSLNPNKFVNTRLQALSQLYEKYRFRKATMHFTSNENTAYKGSVLHGWDPDPKDELLEGQAKINQVESWPGHVDHKVMESMASHYVAPRGQAWLFMQEDGSDIRFTQQAQYHFVSYSAISYDADLSGELGEIEIEYEIELSGVSNSFSLQNDYMFLNTNATGVNILDEIVEEEAANAWYPFDSTVALPAQVETTGKTPTFVQAPDGHFEIDLIASGYSIGDTLLVVGTGDVAYTPTSGGSLDASIEFAGTGWTTTVSGINFFMESFTDASNICNSASCAIIQINNRKAYFTWKLNLDQIALDALSIQDNTPLSRSGYYITRLYSGAQVTQDITSKLGVVQKNPIVEKVKELEKMLKSLGARMNMHEPLVQESKLPVQQLMSQKNPITLTRVNTKL
jgi:hypothetical protein